MDIPYPVSKTALLQSTYENKIEEVTRLIDNGADINEKLRYNYNDDDNEYDECEGEKNVLYLPSPVVGLL